MCFRWGAEGSFDSCFKTISIHHNIEISSDLDRKIQFKPSVLFVITFRLHVPTMDSIKICRAKNCRDIGHLTGVGVKKTHVTCLSITFRRGSWEVSSLLNRLLIRTAHLLKATKCFNLFVVVHQRIFRIRIAL